MRINCFLFRKAVHNEKKNCRENEAIYLLVAREPSSERVCITRRMESRVTMPTIWGAPSLEPLTTGI